MFVFSPLVLPVFTLCCDRFLECSISQSDPLPFKQLPFLSTAHLLLFFFLKLLTQKNIKEYSLNSLFEGVFCVSTHRAHAF